MPAAKHAGEQRRKEESDDQSGQGLFGVLVDHSGSVEALRDDMEVGPNTFIKEQASQPGFAQLSLAQFDAV
jgi:hypothetical protein